jgi:hypothetical protein
LAPGASYCRDLGFGLLLEILGLELILEGVDRLRHLGPGLLHLRPGRRYFVVALGVPLQVLARGWRRSSNVFTLRSSVSYLV